MSTIKYMTKADIQEINQASIKAGRNRTLEPDSLENGLMEDTKYPILMTFLHNDAEVRVQIAIPGKPDDNGHDLGFFFTPFLDMTIEEFNDLEETEVDPDPGNVSTRHRAATYFNDLDGLTGWGDLENN